MERVVSLLPGATEAVCALGCRSRLVARSHACDLPAEVQRLPAVTAPRLDPSAPGHVIDARVKQLVSRALSVYEVDAERLHTLAPDGILTQTRCEVCAVTPRDLEEALAAWLGQPPQVVSLAPASLADVLDGLVAVADALGVPERGRTLRAAQQTRLDVLTAEARCAAGRPRVACLEWIDPPMGSGLWVPELVARAGGECVLGTPDAAAPWISFEALRETDPDLLVVLPCGFDRVRTRTEMKPLLEQPDWPRLRAVARGRVYLADGNRHFNRPGPRMAESLEILTELIQPDRFDFGHEGHGWERLETEAPR